MAHAAGPPRMAFRHEEDHGHRECPDRISFEALADRFDLLFLLARDSGKTQFQRLGVAPHLSAFFVLYSENLKAVALAPPPFAARASIARSSSSSTLVMLLDLLLLSGSPSVFSRFLKSIARARLHGLQDGVLIFLETPLQSFEKRSLAPI